MLSWKIRAAAVAAAVVLLGATASVSAAQAMPKFPHVKSHIALHNLPKGVQKRIARSKTQIVPTTNPLLDSDILLEVDNGAYGSVVAEGHLTLHHKSGTTYTGSFVDDLYGGKKYKASATGVLTTEETAHVTLKAHTGTYTFGYANGVVQDGTKAPKKYLSGAKTFVDSAVASVYDTQLPLNAFFAEGQVGPFHVPLEAEFELTIDANGFIVPYIKHVSNSEMLYAKISGHKIHTAKISSWGQYTPVDGSGDGFLQVSVKANGTNYSIIANELDSTANYLLGDATSGHGKSYFDTTFIGDIA